MKARVRFAGLALTLLLLVACAQGDETPAGESVVLGPTVAATPTLLPGLPTSTPWSAEDPQQAENQAPAASATAKPPPTAAAPPTATPEPAERLELGQTYLENEDFAAAVDQYQAGLLSDELTETQRQEALLALGQAQLATGQEAAAAEAFGTLLADVAGSNDSGGVKSEAAPGEAAGAYYYLAQSYAEQGDCRAAIGAYTSYLKSNDALAAYIQPLIAGCHLALGERELAIAAYEAAVAADAHPEVMVGHRYRLAQLYLEDGDYPAAVQQYDAVLKVAQTQNTLGEATYLAGFAELMAGNPDEGYARYLEAVQDQPQAYESYLALVALIDAGYEVDDFRRGVVDYYAKAYEPAVTIFSRYLESPGEHEEDAHLYLAWSLEGLGNVQAALEQLQVYIDAHKPAESAQAGGSEATPEAVESPDPLAREAAARGTIEQGKMMARAGLLAEAAEKYNLYLETFPDEEDGPFAAWWSAAIAEGQEDIPLAIERYQALADLYPNHDDADEALFRAGSLSYAMGEIEQAQALWESAATRYPDDHFGAAALVWLLRIVEGEEREPWLTQAGETRGSTYYPLRAQHIASGTVPFEASPEVSLEAAAEGRRVAESWLSEQVDVPDGADLAVLSEELAGDGRLVRGQTLWQLGQRQEAKRELESLRADHATDPLASYQLALFFRELGLYRSSILAAASLMSELDVDVFDAPAFIAGLAYPTYYADLITTEAQTYGYDPLLQFSLVRQESLFESFATSGATAQGLSQVIPDTGAYIAQRLDWVDFVNDDLYKPYVGITFGAFYLDQQLNAFDGDIAAALSAYNAGPGNAARWYEAAGGDIDLYVETVDFSETRQYVERIYAGQAIYRHLYGGD